MKMVGAVLRSGIVRPKTRRSWTRRHRHRAINRTVCFGGNTQRRSRERLLRYPNGDTRLIRYPATEPESEAETHHEQKDSSPKQNSNLKTNELPSSPAELIRLVQSGEYIKAQNEHRQRIRDSYEIMEICPWEVPRRMFVLTVEEEQMYTMRTRLHQDGITSRLKRMFRGPNFKGDFIQVDRITDGVISFLDLDNAERFRSLVEAEGSQSVEVREISSIELFEGIKAAKAVTVLMKNNDYCPSISELTTSLKSQEEFDK